MGWDVEVRRTQDKANKEVFETRTRVKPYALYKYLLADYPMVQVATPRNWSLPKLA